MNTKLVQLGFALGRDHALSVAEIFAVFTRKGVAAQTLHYDKDILIVECDNSDISISELGGTIKIFEVLGEYTDIADIKAKLLDIVPFETKKRVNFGISSYGKLSKKVVLNLGYEIKEHLKESGYSARFVTGKNADLSSVIVNENKLIERGFEAILIRTNQTYILGRTVEVQDYKAYSKRDFDRPNRDDKNGMLPPKLAQILINLAEKPLDSTIYDPFCGSGTVLQEALLLDYTDVYGSDIAEKNVEDTKANLKWLTFHSEIKALDDSKVFVHDVLSPSPVIPSERTEPRNPLGSITEGSLQQGRDDNRLYDAIVGEGFLGEPHRRDKDQAVKDADELTDFYLKALTNLKKQLKPGGRIVLAVPFFIVGTEYFYLPILDKLEQTGLKLVKPNIGEAELRLFGRGNLTYSRADQFVGREILILEK